MYRDRVDEFAALALRMLFGEALMNF